MKRLLLFVFLSIALYSPARSQLSVAKMFGKNAFNSTIGFGLFDYTDFPVNAIGNRSVIFGFDFAFFPPKDPDINSVIGYASIKVGYRYIFSEETRTGFYVEPSLGYCKVANDEGDGVGGDGVAAAIEGGYTVEVGQKGNSLNFGLKYEADMAGSNTSLSSIAFRVAYTFRLFRRRGY